MEHPDPIDDLAPVPGDDIATRLRIQGAMAQIKSIMERDGLTGIVLLHAVPEDPDAFWCCGEHLYHLGGRHSLLTFTPEHGYSFPPLAAHEIQRNPLLAQNYRRTTNMVNTLLQMGAPLLMQLCDLQELFKAHGLAQHEGGPINPHA